MTEEELESKYKNVNLAMRHFVMICLTILAVTVVLVSGIYLVDRLSDAAGKEKVFSDPQSESQTLVRPSQTPAKRGP